MKGLMLFITLFISINAVAYPTTFLEMHSESGDYIGQGRDYFFTELDGTFTAKQSYYGNADYLNNSISLSFISPGYADWWYLDFSTHEMGIDLTEGSYSAVRFPFEPAGSAGMSISGNGRGSNTLTGIFSILEIDFGINGAINSFAATFEQHSEGAAPALFGKIAYNSNVFSVDETGSLVLMLVGLVGLGLRSRMGARQTLASS